jgi:histidinol phosphatase-like PHP family hydrolase
MNFIIDLHTHSLLSDGILLPSELVRQAEIRGVKYLGITDHVDSSNIDIVLPNIIKVCKDINRFYSCKAIPGVEITHVPPEMIQDLTVKSRKMGAKLIIVHGETISEPVIQGTNRAALNCDIDILAHPGLLTTEDAKLAKEREIALEITSRSGHSLTNGHVAKLAKELNIKLVLNTDAHTDTDLMDLETAKKIAYGSGLDTSDFDQIIKNSIEIVEKTGLFIS